MLNDNAPVFADVNYDITIVENTKGPTLLETTDADAGFNSYLLTKWSRC